MRKIKRIVSLLCCLVGTQMLMAQSYWPTEHLQEVKSSLHKAYYKEAFDAMIKQADALLNAEPLSVMQKPTVPVSGDMHDYMSLARYMWPDPTKPDGLPWVSHDGDSNPALEKYDRNPLGYTADRVTLLSLAYYFTGEEKYAAKATELLRVWFLNKATRMNPNLNYAQVKMGHNGNRGSSGGTLDGLQFVEMLEGVQLLESSKSFTAKDQKQLKAWFKQLLNWILTSENGQKELAGANNHATAADMQVIAFALYSGDKETAVKTLQALPEKRMFTQIEPDGRQPQELRRTLAFGYSQYNLSHFITIFLMGQKLGIQLDNATSADGRSFYKAMEWLSQYVGKDVADFPYKQIKGWDFKQQEFCKDIYIAATYLQNATASRKSFMKTYRQNRKLVEPSLFDLIYYKATPEDDAFVFAGKQLNFAIQTANKEKLKESNAIKRKVIPRTINADGSLSLVAPRDWCSGFFAGSLWQMYAYTNDSTWRQKAISWTWPIEEIKSYKGTHDLGFMIYCSFGNAFDLTGERSYSDVVMEASRSLISRYNPTIGCIRSWDHHKDRWTFPVIVDNMMNLEMLFRATQISGDSIYWKVAVNHANTTMKNHFRSDYSSFHVVDYNPENGSVRGKCTHQGYSDDSFWSRGQGWGLYGYTMCYRFTKDPTYLAQAQHIAEFWMSLPDMPKDNVPYWDMKAPDKPNAIRDASAAALIASALYELSHYVTGEKATSYKAYADKIVLSLHEGYQAELGKSYGFILLHSTGNFPGNVEKDVPLNYADYYYLEALNRRLAEEYK